MATVEDRNRSDLLALIEGGGLRTLFQPVVDLDGGATVGYEALTRGPEGSPHESPVALFEWARAVGAVGELDRACQQLALRRALEAGLHSPLALFINIEPAASSTGDGEPGADASPDNRHAGLVVEFTERDLTADPAGVINSIEWLRGRGDRVAVDDLGSSEASLAMISVLDPDVIKLDRSLIQAGYLDDHATHTVNAAIAEAERSGAVVLAEGIETDHHLTRARAMGATLGQG